MKQFLTFAVHKSGKRYNVTRLTNALTLHNFSKININKCYLVWPSGNIIGSGGNSKKLLWRHIPKSSEFH